MKTRYFMTILAMAALLTACAPNSTSTDAATLVPVMTDTMESIEPTSAPSEETPSTPTIEVIEVISTIPVLPGNVFDVEISGFTFEENTITIKIGDTVTWTNHDDSPHTVVADDGSFKSSSLVNDASYSQTFLNAGTFNYHCGIHASMTGTVIVIP